MILPGPKLRAPTGSSRWRNYRGRQSLLRPGWPRTSPSWVRLVEKNRVTDNDWATMMTSHGAVQGYNSQALIDAKHQVIVHGEAFGHGQDHGHVPPMLEGTLANLQSIGYGAECFTGKIFTADSNYHTLVNLRKCRELKLDAYIPDRKFRNRDPRFDTQKRRRSGRFTLKDFYYDETLDQYSCPYGKVLKLKAKRCLDHGNLYRKYV